MYVMYNVYGLSWLCNLYDGRYQCFDTSMATGQVVGWQWLYLVVGHSCYSNNNNIYTMHTKYVNRERRSS